MEWKSNGDLLKLMIENNFSCLLTFDKNIGFQQNFKTYSIPVIVLIAKNNTYLILKELIPQILELLSKELSAGIHIVSNINN